MPRADLHTHTTASDGRLAPAALVRKAHAAGLAALSITDHDTVDAYAEAQPVADELGLDLVPGVELSANVGGRDVHLLGYGFDLGDTALRAHLARYRAERVGRAEAIVARLDALGHPVPMARVREIAGGGVIARPHLARAIVEAGHAETTQDAFARFLGEDAPAFVPKGTAGPEELVALVHGAGGVVVLAHPAEFVSLDLLARLLAAGLDGVETVHPMHGDGLTKHWRAAARRHGLLETGGSDYHGFHEADEARFGAFTVPAYRVRPLRRAAEARA
jgi:3',5'-nucleoside bisphosphate phosphatase